MSTSNRPPKQTLKDTGDSVAFLSAISIKGGSTADMMKGFVRAQYNVPESVSDTDPKFIRITIEAVRIRHTEQAVKDYPSQIQSTMNLIQEQIAQLEALGSRSAREEAQNKISNFASHKADAMDRIQLEEKLAENIDTIVNDGNVQIKEVVTIMVDLKSTDADIQALSAEIRNKLQKVDEKLEEVGKQADQLHRNEKVTQDSLDFFMRDIKRVVRLEGEKLGKSFAPEMGHKLEQG